MKTSKLLILCGALAGFAATIAMTGCATSTTGATTANPDIKWDTTGGKKAKNVDLLFVQNARGVSFKNGTMTLRGVNPATIAFSDRPERFAGHMPTSRFVPMWNQGTNSFVKDPPNATLSVMRGDTVSDMVVEIQNPRLAGNNLTYDVKVLDGKIPSYSGPCSLFIDIIGMPLTPMSYAGAARRAYRRGAYYGGPTFVDGAPVYGPTVVHYGPYGTTVIRR